MRIAGLLVLAAAAVPAVMGSQVRAAFVEFSKVVQFPRLLSGQEVATYRVYANFTSDQDRVTAVHCGIGEALMTQFYQNPFGTWTEPPGALFPVFPDLAFDTFVTIGLSSLSSGQSATVITPGSTFGAAESKPAGQRRSMRAIRTGRLSSSRN